MGGSPGDFNLLEESSMTKTVSGAPSSNGFTEGLPPGVDSKGWGRYALLTPIEMGKADRLTIEGGVPGYTLMKNAGAGIASAIVDRFPPGKVAVLCGPGNNGGDGFVVARLLAEKGWTVRVGLLGETSRLKGDAAQACEDWDGSVEALTPDLIRDADLIIDAVFGAGLDRAPDDAIAGILEVCQEKMCQGVPIVAVDVPSGVDGADGTAYPGALEQSAVTVTFFRGKPGHWLLPGREICGETVLVDIGIPEAVLESIAPGCALNHPDLWRHSLPKVTPYSHKFSRGFVVVAGGAEMIGAACLAARAAQRAGAGIVSVAAPVQQGPLYRLALESAVVRSIKDTRGFVELLNDERIGCVVIGPGLGVTAPGNHEKVLAALRAGKGVVLDADALSLFADSPDALFEQIGDRVLLTPHEGEFAKLFPDLANIPSKLDRARMAAERAGGVVLLKGFDTVIADPSGCTVINASAPPHLATAGAGDVLAGLAAAMIAGGMSAFSAACAASYIHGLAASTKGPGMIASDLPDLIPPVVESVRVDSVS